MAWYKYLSVEVPLLFCMFAMALQGAVYTNLYMYRACYVILGYNESDCAQLGNEANNVTAELEPKVQPTVNNITMVLHITGTLLPLIFCMYVGTWSDKFGRKPFLLLSLIGVMLQTLGNTIIVHFSYISPWWFLITSIPSLVTGGFTSLMIIISAYLIDVTTKEDRVIRLSLFEIIMAITSFSGNMLSSYVFYATSYQTIFLIGLSLQGASFLYVLLFIKESVQKKKNDKKTLPSLNDLLDHINPLDIIKDTIKKRDNNVRTFLFIVVGIQLLGGFTMGGGSLGSLFLRAKLHWTLSKLTMVSSITSVGFMIGTTVGTFVLYKTFKIKELPLALFATVTECIGSLLRALATNDYYIYAAYAVTIFQGMSGLMWRTIMSYMLAPEEMGKIFAAVNMLSSLNGLVSGVVYPQIYNATLNTNSGTFYYLTAGIYAVMIVIIICLLRVKFPHYEAPPEAKTDTEENNRKYSFNISINNFEVLSINEKRDSKRTSLPIDIRSISSNTVF